MPRVSCSLLGFMLLAASGFLAHFAAAAQDAVVPPAVKTAVPDAEARRNAHKLINETFAKDLSNAKKPAEKAAIARQLLQAAKESRNDPAGTYEMLSMARDLAVAGGDAETALGAITGLDQYAIDALKLKTDALAAILRAAGNSPDALNAAANVGPVVDEALLADRYGLARQLAELAVTAARSAKDAEALGQANARLEEVKEVEAASGAAAKAAGVLATKPSDPAASLTVGRFEAFFKRNWEKGLPLLAAGSDSTLKGLAQLELAAPNDIDKLASLADGWWTASEKERGVSQAHLREHAAKWYKVVVPRLSALAKVRAEKRLKETAVVQMAHIGWVDVLKLVKTDRDTVIGKWSMDKGQLIISGSDPAELKITAKLASAYVLRVEYLRSAGAELFGVYLPVGENQVVLVVKPQHMGLETLDGKLSSENETTKTGNFDGDKKKHILDIAVWQGGGQDARIIVLFDGKQQIDWTGAPSRLKVHYNWVLPAPVSLGLASYRTAFVVSGFGMKENLEPPPPLPGK